MPVSELIQDIQVEHSSARPDITTVVYQRPYSTFKKVKRNLSGKKPHRKNHCSKLLGGSSLLVEIVLGSLLESN